MFRLDRRLIFICVIVFILSGGLFYRARGFHHDIDGRDMTFRQAHVASNIYYFVRDGISITTRTFPQNMTYRMFDFPIYQQLVAALCIVLGTDIVMTARAFNILMYLLTYATLCGIMICCKSKKRVIFFTLFFYSVSPLNVFYNRAVTPDNLAILLAFLSLLCFLMWDKKSVASWQYVAMLCTGIGSALIKNPIYLPIVCTFLTWFIVHQRARSLCSFRIGVFAAAIGLTVILHRLFSNYLNVQSFETPAWEVTWYFSLLSQRLQASTYTTIINRFFLEVTYPPVFMLFLMGLPLYVLNRRNRLRRPDEFVLALGLLLGTVLTILIFLNPNFMHNYYQLPYVFIISFFSAYGFDWFLTEISKLTMSYKYRNRSLARSLLSIVVIMFFLYTVRSSLLNNEEPHGLIEAGKFIQAHTSPQAFIVYITTEDTWDPSFLYYAKREGYNVSIEQFRSGFLRDTIDKYHKCYTQLYLYLPETVLSQNEEIVMKYKNNDVQYCCGNGCLVQL